MAIKLAKFAIMSVDGKHTVTVIETQWNTVKFIAQNYLRTDVEIHGECILQKEKPFVESIYRIGMKYRNSNYLRL